MFKTNTQQQEAVWQVMRWLTNTDAAAHYRSGDDVPGAAESVLTHPEYQAVRERVPQFETFIEA